MNRHDFLFLFDCLDANPNGDPDAGNLPRVDAESGHGLVTDVCLKRKIRNFVQTTAGEKAGNEIYVREKAVLNDQHERAYTELKLDPAKAKQEEIEKTRNWMCQNFFDIRTFGAVMSTGVNCGQVRGPVQLAFSRSIDPVVSSEFSVTRCAVTTKAEAEKQEGDNRTMGRKFTVPYALYRTHGFVNPFLAKQTGFGDADLELLFTALENAFQFDASAARPAGSMAPRLLLVFKHDSELGKEASHRLFERLKIESFERTPATDGKPPRSFEDYRPRVTFDGKPIDDVVKSGGQVDLGNGVTLIRKV